MKEDIIRKTVKAHGRMYGWSLEHQFILQKLSRKRTRRRCKLTDRPRGFLRGFDISRVQFRQLALNGKIPGYRKASW